MKKFVQILDILAFFYAGAICAYLISGTIIISSPLVKRRRIRGKVSELSFAVFDLISNKYQSMFEDALLDGYIARHHYMYFDYAHGYDRSEKINDEIFFYSVAAHPSNRIYNSGFHKVSMLLTEIKAVFKAYGLVWKNNIGFVKAHDPHLLGLNGLIVSKLFGLPRVLHMNSDFDMKYRGTGRISSPVLVSRGIERLFELKVMDSYDLIMADRKFYSLSRNFSRAGLLRKYRAFGVRVDRSHYLSPETRHNLKEELGILGKKALLYVGRLHPVKYPEDVIKAFGIIKNAVNDSVLIIAGAGKLKDELCRMAKEKAIESSVLFVGQVKYERLIDLLFTADVLLAPHGGVTLVESALAGTPAVAYEFDWHSEFLRDGEMGYLVSFRDYESMAEKAIIILNDPELRRKMSLRCRETAVSNYSREESMMNERAVYKELIGV